MIAWPAAWCVFLGLGSGAVGPASGPVPDSDPPPWTDGTAQDGDPGPDQDPDPDGSQDGPVAPPDPPATPTAAASARTALSRILPCGAQVIVARDDTLPVAAVVLAVEIGSEHDPEELPGLVHALAFQLDQGNRETPPGGAPELAHAAGGAAGLAVGLAQVRFESLVPITHLDAAISIEASRLRAPTVSESLWTESLRSARRDRRLKRFLPFDVLAETHASPGLGHDGRTVEAPLFDLPVERVGEELARRFTYARSTLVVVAPGEPEVIMGTINRAFSDLPATDRTATPLARPPAPTGPGPRSIPVEGGKGDTFAWPVSPDPAAVAWATALCRTYNRQIRTTSESKRTRLRCHFEPDPRRPTLVLWARGTDDGTTLVNRRMARIREGRDARLLEIQRQIVERRLRRALSTPLELARHLAAAAPQTGPSGPTTALDIDRLGGLAGLDDPLAEHVPTLLTLDGAVRLDRPPADASSETGTDE